MLPSALSKSTTSPSPARLRRHFPACSFHTSAPLRLPSIGGAPSPSPPPAQSPSFLLPPSPSPSQNHYAATLRSCILSRAVRPGRQLHARLLVSGLGLDPAHATRPVDLYASCGHVPHAPRLFDGTPQRRNVFLWNVLIRAYARDGPREAGVELVQVDDHDATLCSRPASPPADWQWQQPPTPPKQQADEDGTPWSPWPPCSGPASSSPPDSHLLDPCSTPASPQEHWQCPYAAAIRQATSFAEAALRHHNADPSNKAKYDLVEAGRSCAMLTADGLFGHVNFVAMPHAEYGEKLPPERFFFFAEVSYDAETGEWIPTCLRRLDSEDDRVGGVVDKGMPWDFSVDFCISCDDAIKHPKDGTSYQSGHFDPLP